MEERDRGRFYGGNKPGRLLEDTKGDKDKV